jgi:hypothetical protein
MIRHHPNWSDPDSLTGLDIERRERVLWLRNFSSGARRLYRQLLEGQSVTYTFDGQTVTARWHSYYNGVPVMEYLPEGHRPHRPIVGQRDAIHHAAAIDLMMHSATVRETETTE